MFHTGRPLLRNKRLSPLSEKPNPLTPANLARHQGRPASPAPSSINTIKKNKVRWHFGIRSRSEPLEVMLEIYRTLKTLGFEWRAKDPEKRIDLNDYSEDSFADERSEIEHRGRERERENGAHDRERERDEAIRRRNKKRQEEEEFMRKAQALYFIETRCRVDDVIVRMDLQLYSIDPENYLVDFRNLGYRLIRTTPRFGGGGSNTSYEDVTAAQHLATASHEAATINRGAQQSLRGESTGPSFTSDGAISPNVAASSPQRSYSGSRRPSQDPTMPTMDADSTTRQLWEAAAKARALAGQESRPKPHRASSHHSSHFGTGGVSSPFLFLECACKLIVELGMCNLFSVQRGHAEAFLANPFTAVGSG